MERKKQQAQNEEGSTPNKSKPPPEAPEKQETEAERKIKTLFLKETSKIVVKNLEEYRASIKSKEDFKALAKKVKQIYFASII